MSVEYDHLLKLLLLGDPGVGKSSILLRFVQDMFVTNYVTTIGIDFKIKTIQVDGKIIKLQLWDTAGQRKFQVITSSYFRSAAGIILVYDCTNLETFTNLQRWLQEVEHYAQPNVPKLLVANKCELTDLKVIDYNMGNKLAEAQNMPFLEVSAKNDTNIDQIFTILTSHILTEFSNKYPQRESIAPIDLGQKKEVPAPTGRSRCC